MSREHSAEGRAAGPGGPGGASGGRSGSSGGGGLMGAIGDHFRSEYNRPSKKADGGGMMEAIGGHLRKEYNSPSKKVEAEKPYTPGAVPNVPQASLGQIIGALMNALPGGMLNQAGEAVDGVTEGDFSGVSKGGFVGSAIDGMTGEEPGKQEGWSPDRYRGNDSLGGVGGSGGPVGESPIRPLQTGGPGHVFNEGEENEASLAGALKRIISQPGAWPPVRPSAV
jgi:hypothetical protein